MERIDKKKTEIQTYLKERINPILEPLTVALIKSRPENIVEFCVNWLKNFSICSIMKIKRQPIKTMTLLSLMRRMTLWRSWSSNRKGEVWSRGIDLQFLPKSMDNSINSQPSFQRSSPNQRRPKLAFSFS